MPTAATLAPTRSVQMTEPSAQLPVYIVDFVTERVEFDLVARRSELDRALVLRGHHCWALIGASDPYSLRLDPTQNEERAACLRRLLEAAGYLPYQCHGRCGWIGSLVPDMQPEAAADWGRDFAQSHIWWSEVGKKSLQKPCAPLSFEI